MTALKVLVDGAAFADNLRLGLSRVIGATVVEGKGDLMPDVQPDSLFLRHLGHDARLARRYHVVYGKYVSGKRVLGLWASFLVAKLALKKAIRDRADSVVVRASGLRLVDGLELTDEVLDGDLVVSVASAWLKGAGRQTATACHHQALKTDAGVMRTVAEFLFAAAPLPIDHDGCRSLPKAATQITMPFSRPRRQRAHRQPPLNERRCSCPRPVGIATVPRLLLCPTPHNPVIPR